ncbi:hypothetical protein L3Q67_02355 [Saccharothrix sp. AJ9571]|nr:hypothetical protein L3Q67_02355 [Saccharothrix sp. AJ9571]
MPAAENISPRSLSIADVGRFLGQDGLPELTSYVEREHDKMLRAQLRHAVSERRSTVITLTSNATSGKKRSFWEALHEVDLSLESWHVWPTYHPSTPDRLLAVLSELKRFSILWLPDVIGYFPDERPDLREQVAIALRDVLNDKSLEPVLVLATARPHEWQKLVAHPRPYHRDNRAHTRAIFEGSDLTVDEAFTSDELNRALASSDPRILEAAKNCDNNEVVQYLVAVPDLLNRVLYASPAAKAFIAVMVGARSLLHGQWVPEGVIKAAAPAFLQERDRRSLGVGWFDRTVAELEEIRHGGAAVVTSAEVVARAKDDSAESVDPKSVRLFRLHDFIEKRELRESVLKPPNRQLIDALVSHGLVEFFPAMAVEVKRRMLYRDALRFYSNERWPDRSGWRNAGLLLHELGVYDSAINCYRSAIESGDQEALVPAFRLCEGNNSFNDLIGILSEPDVSCTREVLTTRGQAKMALGRHVDAIADFRAAAAQGDDPAMRMAAFLMASRGNLTEAVEWLLSEGKSGRLSAVREAADLIAERQGLEVALTWLQEQVEKEMRQCLLVGAEMLLAEKRFAEAIDWSSTGCEYGIVHCASVGVMAYVAARMLDRAYNLAKQGAALGDYSCYVTVGDAFAEVGMYANAFESYATSAAGGFKGAYAAAIKMAARRGWTEDLRGWHERACRIDAAPSCADISALLCKHGHDHEAIAFGFRHGNPTQPDELLPIASALVRANRVDDAVERLVHATMTSRAHARMRVAEIMMTAGEVTAAISLFASAGSDGLLEAYSRGASSLVELRRATDAIWLLRKLCPRGLAEESLYIRAMVYMNQGRGAGGNYDGILELVEEQLSLSNAGAVVSFVQLITKPLSYSELTADADAERNELQRLSLAVRLLRRAIQLKEPSAVSILGQLLARMNQHDEALSNLTLAVVCGLKDAVPALEDYLKHHGRVGMEDKINSYGLCADGEVSPSWKIEYLRST